MTTDNRPASRLIEGKGYRLTWGIRRADGQPWRTQPTAPGLYDYYAADEVSSDAMVLGCGDSAAEAVACFLSQARDADVPHPGKALIVRVKHRYEEPLREWGYWYADVTGEEVAYALKSQAQDAIRMLSELVNLTTFEENTP